MKNAKLNSPINAPRMQADRDKQSKAALSKSGGKQLPKAKATLSAADKAEKASYTLNRTKKF